MVCLDNVKFFDTIGLAGGRWCEDILQLTLKSASPFVIALVEGSLIDVIRNMQSHFVRNIVIKDY